MRTKSKERQFLGFYIFLLALGVVSMLTPSRVLACSVCFLAKKENLMAYFGTGVLLSVLPFALIGGLGWWVYRRLRLPM